MSRSLAAGALAGLAGFLSARFSLGLPLAWLAVTGVALAHVRGDRWDRILLTGLSIVLPAVPWLFGLSAAWTVGMAGAAAGVLMVKARLTERGEEGNVGLSRPGVAHYAAAALATGGLTVAGTEVAKILFARLTQLSTPELLSFAASGTIVALFAGLGSLASHVALQADPVEARVEALLPSLSGEFEAQLARALNVYRQAGVQLAALPRDAAREELARTLSKLTRDAAELAADWSGVEAHVQESAHQSLQKDIDELQASAKSSRDAVARQQLELAAKSLAEELERLGELKLKRERVLARLKSQVALLERARVALIGLRSTHATVRAAELSAVSRKLNALALSQAEEAKAGHEVATSVELTTMAAVDPHAASGTPTAATAAVGERH